MRNVLTLILLLVSFPAAAATKVVLLHFSDYHSHALPFYTDEGERGGIARAIPYLRGYKRAGAIVLNGGDMINRGAPAWSDKYGCVEWRWMDGDIDAMAFGNHDADYGKETFERCRRSIGYPILSANTKGFPPYAVFERYGARIGVFAVAGKDFRELVQTPGFEFTDPVAAAREVVRTLRRTENVDAVVMIGHQHAEDDYALAKAVPGIDVIFGTHSHLKQELTKIPDTETWFISPWQYLAYISKVEITISNRRVTDVTGKLVPVDSKLRENVALARRVRVLQRALEDDPQFSELFVPIAKLAKPISLEALAERTLGAMRTAVKADVALSSHSSFRNPLPAGTITPELVRAALPYDNEIVVCSMTGEQLQKAIDDEMYVSGSKIEPKRTYRVATTDYLAFVAKKDAFNCDKQRTGKRVRTELTATLSP